MSDEPDKSTARTSRLLGDLESIRSLLDDEAESPADASAQPRPEPSRARPGAAESRAAEHADEDAAARDSQPAGESPPGGEDDVPLLEDVVRGGVSVNESFLSGEAHFELTDESASGLDDDVFKALLSDEWRDSARDLLDQARAVIEKHQTEWTPAHTDELNQALRVRIDDTVDQWLKQVVQERIDELRRRLLDAVADELHATVADQFDPTGTTDDEDPDGA